MHISLQVWISRVLTSACSRRFKCLLALGGSIHASYFVKYSHLGHQRAGQKPICFLSIVILPTWLPSSCPAFRVERRPTWIARVIQRHRSTRPTLTTFSVLAPVPACWSHKGPSIPTCDLSAIARVQDGQGLRHLRRPFDPAQAVQAARRWHI